MTAHGNVLPEGRSYRTLEERFLAEYAALEEERDGLAARNAELEAELAEKRTHIRLDAMVRAAGREKVLQGILGYRRAPTVSDRSYEEWALQRIGDAFEKPGGASDQEIIDYFEPELTEEYEKLVELLPKGGCPLAMMPEFTTDEFEARARGLIGDMHGLLQRICERRDECGRDCELWPDHDKLCGLRDIEERMAVLGIEVRE